MMVLRRCAMVRTVQSSNWVLIVDCIKLSVSRSTAAVASSKTRILVFLRRARAKQTSCRWPKLKPRNPVRSYVNQIMNNHCWEGVYTWDSLLLLNTHGWVFQAGQTQSSWDVRVPELSRPPRQCSHQRGPGSYARNQRTALDPRGERLKIKYSKKYFFLVFQGIQFLFPFSGVPVG